VNFWKGGCGPRSNRLEFGGGGDPDSGTRNFSNDSLFTVPISMDSQE